MRLAARLFCLALLAAPALAVAQSAYPSKPIKVVLPLPAGGIGDIAGVAPTSSTRSTPGAFLSASFAFSTSTFLSNSRAMLSL